MWLHAEVDTLGDIPRYYARHCPERTALIDGAGKLSFGELDAISDRIAAALAARLDTVKHVGFLGKNSSRYFQVLFGAAKAGWAVTPLNWRLPPAELAPIIDDAQCSLVWVDHDFAAVFGETASRCRQTCEMVAFDSSSAEDAALLSWLASSPSREPEPRIHPDDTVALIYTSGTTGCPKGVQLTHRTFAGIRLCEHLEPALDFQDGDVMLTVMPVFHLVGTGLSVQALYNGAAVSLLPALEPEKLLELIERDRPSICALVPTAIQMMLDHPKAKTTDFSSLRLVMYAGSPISAALLKRAMAEMKCKLMQFYGSTEASGALTLLRPEQHDLHNEEKLKSCGTPLPLIEFRVVDDQGQEVPDGQRGEFMVRGPNMFRGYWNAPEASRAVLKDGWYRTGDAGYRDKDGLLYIVDRVKDMIVTGGENVYSAEVEQVLYKHPAVKTCAVVGLPDERWGERITAVIIPASGEPPDAAAIIAHCREHIAGYKVPKEIRFVDSLPVTPTGKVQKRMLREQLSATAVSVMPSSLHR
ncbi:MAG: long-chain-fatty-acid--CoA ligase [Gammaproteobacteria bacterium]|nr:long-chain-fatty-acid--CoA ligase [Gammaproteobacteria bacterium]